MPDRYRKNTLWFHMYVESEKNWTCSNARLMAARGWEGGRNIRGWFKGTNFQL